MYSCCMLANAAQFSVLQGALLLLCTLQGFLVQTVP